MNQTISDINDDYIKQFRTGFNQYVQLKETRPYDSLEKFRGVMWRLGMLVEIWGVLDAQRKEKKHGRI